MYPYTGHAYYTGKLRHRHVINPAPPMSKKKLSEEERTLFRESVAGTRPLPQDKIKPYAHRSKPQPNQRLRDEQEVIQSLLLSDPWEDEALPTGEESIFMRDGVAPTLMRRLRRGQYRIEAELDLHGKTRVEAREALAHFLATCIHHQQRCVRIIHGKGHGSINKQPVLKTHVNHWLQQRDEVLAFCSARPVDGGHGALYVLLRRPR